MAMDQPHSTDRSALHQRLFPGGVPTLWAPTLVFYREDGSIDQERLAAHLGFMAPHVGGVLLGGSTGDAWEMEGDELLALLDSAVPVAQRAGIALLVGILRPTAAAMLEQLESVVAWARRRGGTGTDAEVLAGAGLKGITIAPPTTSSPLGQDAIADALDPVLQRGIPTALYQLPQVTGNVMAPELVAGLAERFPNIVLFKDSGAADEVARSGLVPRDVFLLRGAEGGFAAWVRDNGGCYDGFLLSSANSVPADLASVVRDIAAGRIGEAEACSARISAVIADAFACVAGLPDGNAFANANKALAHCMAYGARALDAPPPRLHAGSHLPRSVIADTVQSLRRHAMLPEQGYLVYQSDREHASP